MELQGPVEQQKNTNIYINGDSRTRGKGIKKKVFEEIITKFPNLMKDVSLEIKESQRTLEDKCRGTSQSNCNLNKEKKRKTS